MTEKPHSHFRDRPLRPVGTESRAMPVEEPPRRSGQDCPPPSCLRPPDRATLARNLSNLGSARGFATNVPIDPPGGQPNNPTPHSPLRSSPPIRSPPSSFLRPPHDLPLTVRGDVLGRLPRYSGGGPSGGPAAVPSRWRYARSCRAM